MKVTDRDFKTFKQFCEEWAKVLNLGDWQIYFHRQPLKDSFAETSCIMAGRVATITLTSTWDNSIRPLSKDSLRKCALHECVHLALAEMRNLATARYITKDELTEREEATTVRFQHAIIGARE